MFDDFFNDKNKFPPNFKIPFDDFMERIILKDVSNMDELIDSFRLCLKDLEKFQTQNYEISIADNKIAFRKQ